MDQEQKEALNYWIKIILFLGHFDSFQNQLEKLKVALVLWFEHHDFVSTNSEDFKEFLEDKVGKISFTQNLTMKVRPQTMLFSDGELKRCYERNLW